MTLTLYGHRPNHGLCRAQQGNEILSRSSSPERSKLDRLFRLFGMLWVSRIFAQLLSEFLSCVKLGYNTPLDDLKRGLLSIYKADRCRQVLLSYLLLWCSVVSAQQSKPGTVTTAIAGADDQGRATVLQPDGKLIVAGFFSNGTNNDVALVRYNTNGTLDGTFGFGGRVKTSIGFRHDEAHAVVLQSDGKIVVVGRSENLTPGIGTVSMAQTNMGIWWPEGTATFSNAQSLFSTPVRSRFRADGVIYTVARGSGISTSWEVYFPANFASTSFSIVDYDFLILRYNANGTLDNSFDGDGIQTLNVSVGALDDIARSVVIQSDGKILVGGNGTNPNASGANQNSNVLVRLNTNGALDNTFGVGGIVRETRTNGIFWSSPGGSYNGAETVVAGITNNSIAIQPDGKILAGGAASGHTPVGGVGQHDVAITRYNSDGSPDDNFGNIGGVKGIVMFDTPGGSEYDGRIVVQPDGKIVMGYTTAMGGGNRNYGLARFNADGSFDNTVGGGTGRVYTPVTETAKVWNGANNTAYDLCYAVALQPDGKILLAGYLSDAGIPAGTPGGSVDFAVVRYNSDLTLDNTFSGDGIAFVDFGSDRTDVAFGIALRPSEKIILAGYAYSLGCTTLDYAVAQFNSDGTLDTDFIGPITCALAATLPVTWLDFTGEQVKERVKLNWQTASEQNSSHFEIERSANGGEYTRIGLVQAAGNSANIRSYEFWDETPPVGTLLYRLRQVDIDARYSYSKVVLLRNTAKSMAKIGPNPTGGSVTLQIPADWGSNVEWRLYNMQGQLLEQRSKTVSGNYTIDLSTRASGTYQLTLWKNGELAQKEWIIRR